MTLSKFHDGSKWVEVRRFHPAEPQKAHLRRTLAEYSDPVLRDIQRDVGQTLLMWTGPAEQMPLNGWSRAQPDSRMMMVDQAWIWGFALEGKTYIPTALKSGRPRSYRRLAPTSRGRWNVSNRVWFLGAVVSCFPFHDDDLMLYDEALEAFLASCTSFKGDLDDGELEAKLQWFRDLTCEVCDPFKPSSIDVMLSSMKDSRLRVCKKPVDLAVYLATYSTMAFSEGMQSNITDVLSIYQWASKTQVWLNF